MRKLTKTLLTAAMLSAASLANASPLFIDRGVNFDADADTQTEIFTKFISNSFSPMSAYLDLEGDGIQNGTIVFDSGAYRVGSLSPLVGFDNSVEGFNTFGGFKLEVTYELFGFAALASDANGNGTFDADTDVLAAQFIDGYLSMDLVDSNGTIDFLDIDVTGSAFNTASGINFSIFGQPVSASNFLNSEQPFFGSTGLGDIIQTLDPVNISALTTLQISNGSRAPTVNTNYSTTDFQDLVLESLGLDSLPQTAQWLTRTTDISSELSLEVSAPSTLALFGLSLLGLGVSRRVVRK